MKHQQNYALKFLLSYSIMSRLTRRHYARHLVLVLHVNCTIVFNFTDPDIMKKLQVDRGAIRFVLAGANIMCPGLTSPGGVLDEEVGAECPVVLPLCFVDCL
jgi:hypothetical protein